MTDRELLELAAKAAGINIEFIPSATRNKGSSLTKFEVVAWHGPFISGSEGQDRWNPLTDDADALRLAVKLRLSLDHNHSADQQRWVASDRNGCEGCYDPVSCVEDEFEENDRAAATRRAITRAAAEIGRVMS